MAYMDTEEVDRKNYGFWTQDAAITYVARKRCSQIWMILSGNL